MGTQVSDHMIEKHIVETQINESYDKKKHIVGIQIYKSYDKKNMHRKHKPTKHMIQKYTHGTQVNESYDTKYAHGIQIIISQVLLFIRCQQLFCTRSKRFRQCI